MSQKKRYKAVSLISGGLDSLLATRLIQDQGIHVEGINFFTGFCVEGHTHAIRKKDKQKIKRNNALWVAEQLGIKLHIIDVISEYKNVVINPKHGYGQNMNPCLDCKGFMVKKAYEWIQQNEFDFIITGEVIGQRPMSQRKETMPIIAKESGAGDLLVRPLCALNLPASRPELEGWIDRTLLKAFSGRSRKPQIELAAKFGFDEYSQPAGGCCFLTDKRYSNKLKDLWQARGVREYELDDIMLLKVGRHIRPNNNFKLIIAREEGEVNYLQGYRKQYTSLQIKSHHGPVSLIDGQANDQDLELAAKIAARYSQGREAEIVEVEVITANGVCKNLKVKPLASEAIPEAWYV